MSFDIRRAQEALNDFIDALRENGFDLVVWDQCRIKDRKIAAVMLSLHNDKIIIVAEPIQEERQPSETEVSIG